METDEFKQAWKSLEHRSSTTTELDRLLSSGLEKASARVKKHQRIDAIVASAVSAGIIICAFLLDLRYRWIVFILMATVASGMFLYLLARQRVKHYTGDLPLNDYIDAGLKQLIRMRKWHLPGLPFFTGLLTLSYLLVFESFPWWVTLLATTVASLLAVAAARLTWNILYEPVRRRFQALKAIARHME